MCGIAGLISHDERGAVEAVRAMNAAQRHRGPDDEGVHSIALRERYLVLGQRRLSILDLSAAGHQPMRNPDTGDWIVFNGEIYNFLELRRELESLGARFTSACDTEVILKAFAQWGVASFEKLCGMFAFGLYAAKTNELILARDPLGIKPLYYAWQGNAFGFASEVRALKTGRVITGEIDRRAVAGMIAYGAVQEPLTIYAGAKALPPGTWAALDLNADARSFSRTGRHWDFPTIAEPAGGRSGALEKLREVLSVAASSHLLSDVPVGVFLSSGIDSTAIAAMCARSRKDMDAFSLRLVDQPALDESGEASQSAQTLGMRHHILEVSDAEVCVEVRAWLNAQDQPSMDGLNTYVISKAVRARGIVVALSGLGGDEVFGGYSTFHDVPTMLAWRKRTRLLPSTLLGFGARIALARSERSKRQKIVETFSTRASLASMYFRRRRLTPDEDMRALGFDARELNLTPEFLPPECEPERGLPANDAAAAVGILETRFYMGNTLLRDSDGCGMAHGLEIRVPLLDRRVLDVAYALPGSMRVRAVRSGQNKAMLADALAGIIPPRVLSLKKRGFNLSQLRWLRGPLKESFHAGLDVLKKKNIAEASAVARLWSDFLARSHGYDWGQPWAMGVLGTWLDINA